MFVFLKLPPAACTIPGYEINLPQCHDSYIHMEPSIKIIHDKHFATRSRQLRPYKGLVIIYGGGGGGGVAPKRNVFRGKKFADPTIKKSKI